MLNIARGLRIITQLLRLVEYHLSKKVIHQSIQMRIYKQVCTMTFTCYPHLYLFIENGEFHHSISLSNFSPDLNTTSRTQNGRSYCDEKVRRTSRILQQIRSTLNKLFIFGDWRMEDIYALYLLGFFGGLLILFLRIEWKGGFSENFDKIDKSVKSDKITQVVKND